LADVSENSEIERLMNIKEAKKIHLPKLMAKLGYHPTSIKKDGYEYWYKSPFRKEKESSFHTSFLGGKWIWNDFGDSGGTVIDFVIRHEHLNTAGEALSYLDGVFPPNYSRNPSRIKKNTTEPTPFSFQQQDSGAVEISTASRELEFLKAHQILNPVIISYLEGRGIPESLAYRYLREVKYRNLKLNKTFFAFGMRNESGGYEIREAADRVDETGNRKKPFKSALIKRDITLIKGQQPESYTVNVFEGMTNFLSLVVMLNVSNLLGDSIVMHSVSSFQRTVIAIRSMKYNKVNTFLDNGKAGQECTRNLTKILGGIVFPQNSLFESYEDLNDALIANEVPDFVRNG
jgi:Toprim-like